MNQIARFWKIELVFLALSFVLFAIGGAHAQVTGQISASGPTALQSQAPGGDGIQSPEIDDRALDAGQVSDDNGDSGIDRILPTAQPGNGASVNSGKKAKSFVLFPALRALLSYCRLDNGICVMVK